MVVGGLHLHALASLGLFLFSLLLLLLLFLVIGCSLSLLQRLLHMLGCLIGLALVVHGYLRAALV